MTNKPQFVGERVKLGDVLKSSSTRNKDSNCVNVYSVTNSKGFVPSEEYFSKEVFSKELRTYRVVERGMIAYNPSRINVGSVALQDKADEVVVSPLYVVFSTDGSKLMPEYLVHFLKSKPGLDQIAFQSIGTVRNNLKFKALCQMELHIPPLGEQQARINTLREIQLQIERAESQIDELDSLVKSRFVEMFGRAEDEHSDFPVKTLDDSCASIVRGPFGSALKKGFFVPKGPGTYKVYEQKHAIQKQVDIGTYYISGDRFETLKRFECHPGDILMSCSGTMGEFYQLPPNCEPGVMNQALCKFTLSDSILVDYFLGFMEQVVGKLGAKGSSIKNVSSVKFIKAIRIPLPPVELQERFAAFASQVDKSRFVNLGHEKRAMQRLSGNKHATLQMRITMSIPTMGTGVTWNATV